MKQWVKWGAVSESDVNSSIFFRWDGGRGQIIVSGFAHDTGESIAAYIETPGYVPSTQLPDIDIQADGIFPFDAPAGVVELRANGSGGSISWTYVIVTSVEEGQ